MSCGMGRRSFRWKRMGQRMENFACPGMSIYVTVDDNDCVLTDFSSALEDQGKISGSMVLQHCVGPSAPVVVSGAKGEGLSPGTGRRRLIPRELLGRLTK